MLTVNKHREKNSRVQRSSNSIERKRVVEQRGVEVVEQRGEERREEQEQQIRVEKRVVVEAIFGRYSQISKKSSPTKGLCSIIHRQVINIINVQLLLAKKQRGDFLLYGQQQIREESTLLWSATDKRGEKRRAMVSTLLQILIGNIS